MADSGLPDGCSMSFDEAPTPELRASIARQINDFHSRTIPFQSQRFGFLVRDNAASLLAGLIGSLSWEWMFIEAVWVSDDLRGKGVGRRLMHEAQAHALASGCHSAWLDTFQAREFYEAMGYAVFGELDSYPRDQSRWFMRRRL